MILEGYKIKRILGEGGWATVYLAEYKGREVALKVLLDKHYSSREKIEEFFLEADILKKIDSPNVAKIIDVSSREIPPFYICMKYYPYGNLESLIKEKKILTTEDIKYIGAEISKALMVIHSKGHLHLDIKPSNILMGYDNEIVLTDFGSSKDYGSILDDETVRGTPQFMSPEHFTGKVNFTSDLYSLGIVLYYMASGQLPFNSDDIHQIALMHIKIRPYPISEYNPGVNRKIEKIILKLLEKKCEDRYQSAFELLKDLNDIKSDELNKNLKIQIEQLDNNGRVIRKRLFTQYPLRISKLGDSPTNFNILDIYASREHATITRAEEGRLLFIDHSKHGSVINGQLIKDESVLLEYEPTNVTIGNTHLKITFIKNGTKKKSMLIKIFTISIFAILLSASIYILNKSNENTLIITDIYLPDTVFVGERFNFHINPSHPLDKLIVAPSGIDKEKFELPGNERSYEYSSISFSGADNTVLSFSIKGIDQKGNESDWVAKNIILMRRIPQDNIKLHRINIDGIIYVGKAVNYTIDYNSTLTDDDLLISIVDDKNGEHFVGPLNQKPRTLVFRNDGRTILRIKLFDISNVIIDSIEKEITINQPIPPPQINFISRPIISKRRMSIAYTFRDSRYTSSDNIQIFLIINNRQQIKIDQQAYNYVHTFSDSGTYKINLMVKTPDGRIGKSNSETVEIR